MPFAASTKSRFARARKKLEGELEDCLEAFVVKGPFAGPPAYFHARTIERRRDLDSVAAAVEDTQFVENLYATLTAWGMHRLGTKATRLIEFGQFQEQLRDAAPALAHLEKEVLGKMAPATADDLWRAIGGLRVSLADARLVAGTKVAHHLLPDLVPPMDRQYTLRFFLGRKDVGADEGEAFKLILGAFDALAASCGPRLEPWMHTGHEMFTSMPKALDNAIVGWSLAHP